MVRYIPDVYKGLMGLQYAPSIEAGLDVDLWPYRTFVNGHMWSSYVLCRRSELKVGEVGTGYTPMRSVGIGHF